MSDKGDNSEKVLRFGKWVVESHGIVELPVSVGKSYHISLEGGSFVRIEKNVEDGFRFVQYRVVNGNYVGDSEGRVSEPEWRRLLGKRF